MPGEGDSTGRWRADICGLARGYCRVFAAAARRNMVDKRPDAPCDATGRPHDLRACARALVESNFLDFSGEAENGEY
jgi:hypothetical protein